MQWLKRAWEFIATRLGFLPAPFGVVYLRELPEGLEERLVYIIGEGNHQWFAALICPCKCGATLYLNLDPHDRPCWEVIKHSGKVVSLFPSIHRQVGCGSHFWLRRGHVFWATRL
jgi:hypothetical protein